MAIKRFEVHRVTLDPAVGVEFRKSRPCLVISPDEMNTYVRTLIIAPMTTRGRDYPSRVSCRLAGKDGQIVLDQVRAVDRSRLNKRLGRIDDATAARVLHALHEMFAP